MDNWLFVRGKGKEKVKSHRDDMCMHNLAGPMPIRLLHLGDGTRPSTWPSRSRSCRMRRRDA